MSHSFFEAFTKSKAKAFMPKLGIPEQGRPVIPA